MRRPTPATAPTAGRRRTSTTPRAVRLGLEQAPAGTALHVVAEEAVTSRAIAEALGEALGLPSTSVPTEEVATALGFVGPFFAADIPASSARAQALLGWTPTGPTLLEDIAAGRVHGLISSARRRVSGARVDHDHLGLARAQHLLQVPSLRDGAPAADDHDLQATLHLASPGRPRRAAIW